MKTMDMNVENLYVAPEVEVLEVAVEAGFAGSELGEEKKEEF